MRFLVSTAYRRTLQELEPQRRQIVWHSACLHAHMTTMRTRMRRRLLLLAILPVAALGQEAEPLARIEATAIAALAGQLPPSARIAASGIDPRLRLPVCSQPPTAEPPAVRGASATVTVRCGQPAWTVYVPLRISDLRPVLVLTRAAARGEILSAALLAPQERDVAQLPFGYFEDPQVATGQQLRRPLAAGAVLTPSDAESPRLVRRGDAVTLIGRSGGIEIRAGGTALGDGAQGERVRVRNDSSRRTVEGMVSGPGLVEVRL